MIDTIEFYINKAIYPESKIWRSLIPKENIKQTGVDRFCGNIRNMEIKENQDCIRVKGSIAKFHNGNNLESFTRKELFNAFSEFEDTTGFELKNAVLRRVDFGKNFIVKNDIAEYLRLFGLSARYKRDVVDFDKVIETVTYFTNTGAFSFCAYDKIKEMRNEKEKIPDIYRDSNVLRMEYRIKNARGIRCKIGHGLNISPLQLAERDIYNELANLFKTFYEKIQKTGRIVFFDKQKKCTKSDYMNLVFTAAWQKEPQYQQDLLNTLLKNGNIDKHTAKRIKALIKKNSQDYTFTDTNELIVELDGMMRLKAL